MSAGKKRAAPLRATVKRTAARSTAAKRTPAKPARKQVRRKSATAPDFLLSIATMRKRGGMKWKLYGPEVLPAWVADMDFSVAPPVQRRLEQLALSGNFSYASDPGYAQAFVDRMQDRFGWKPAAEHVVPVADLVQAITVNLFAFSAPGDKAMLQSPIYPPFLKCIANTRRVLLDVPLADDGKRHVVDEDALRRAVDAQTRIFLLCNPHNPSGRVLTRDELLAIARLAEQHDLVVVSDEIHADLLYEGTHIPFATLGPEIATRTVTITSATKSFNIPGLRAGLMHFGSARLFERFRQVVPDRMLGTVSSFGAEATVAAWRHGQPWLDKVMAYLRRNRDHLAERLRRDLPEIRFRSPEGTYLQWLDCRALNLAPSPFQFFLDKARVGLNPGSDFGAAYGGYARLNFATSTAILDQVLDRMVEAVRKRR